MLAVKITKYVIIIIWGNVNLYYCLESGRAKDINNMGTSNLLQIPNVKNKSHPTQKPVELMKILIENSSNAGDVVLDLFMGTGSTGVATLETGRKFIGCEIDEKYFDVAKERIEEVI